MAGDFQKDGLEDLKKRLYRKGEVLDDTKERTQLPKERIDAPSYWREKVNDNIEYMTKQKKSGSKKKIIWITVILFIIACGGLAAYFFFSGQNVISPKKINFSIDGPTYIDAGAPFVLNIFVENKNQAAIETADLILNFPSGAFSKDGKPLTRTRISLGTIPAQEIVNKEMDIFLLGSEDEKKVISASLEYRFYQSNAILVKDANYEISIIRPAMGVSVFMPSELNARQEINVNLDFVSNSQSTIKDVYAKVIYPPGFQFKNSNIKPSSGQDTWFLGDFNSLEKKTIEINGFIEGQDLEEKNFNIVVGALDEDGNIIPYGNGLGSAIVKRNPIGFNVSINGSDVQKNILRAGDFVRVVLSWQNNLPSPVNNARIEVSLDSPIIDEGSISATGANYLDSEKKIIWDSSNNERLISIPVNGIDNTQFSFKIKDNLPILSSSDKDFSIKLKAKISGSIAGGEGQNINPSTEVEKDIIIASDLKAESLALYRSGPFKNAGLLPPKVGSETTYTIKWSLSGNSSDLKDVKVSAYLPPYIRWINNISPSSENITFSQKDSLVIWTIDKLPSGTGIVSPVREVYFQIGFTPSANQEKTSPVLVNEGSVSAFNDFIKDYLTTSINSVDTRLNNDPGFKWAEGAVIR